MLLLSLPRRPRWLVSVPLPAPGDHTYTGAPRRTQWQPEVTGSGQEGPALLGKEPYGQLRPSWPTSLEKTLLGGTNTPGVFGAAACVGRGGWFAVMQQRGQDTWEWTPACVTYAGASTSLVTGAEWGPLLGGRCNCFSMGWGPFPLDPELSASPPRLAPGSPELGRPHLETPCPRMCPRHITQVTSGQSVPSLPCGPGETRGWPGQSTP